MIISEKVINKTVKRVVEKWLDKNNDSLLDNISLTIQEWMDNNKEQIFKIIKEEANKE